MTTRQTVYEISPEELVRRFMHASARVGISGSGLVIDMMHGENIIEAQYLNGAVLARLHGVKPPFQPNDRVTPKASSLAWISAWDQITIKVDEVLIVDRVFYESGRWTLMFHGLDPFTDDGRLRSRYPAEAFERASETSGETQAAP